MREKFMIERHGKRFVLFAGLLDEAHASGLRSIDTELLQVPEEANGQVAVVKATVEMEDGSGGLRRFGGIGDASPQNVGRNIAPHVIRMAETRAKARALRDAVNVGATSFEELADAEEDGGRDHGRASGRSPRSAYRPGPRPVPSVEDRPNTKPKSAPADKSADGRASGQRSSTGNRKARKSQVDLIRTLALEVRGDGAVEKMEGHIGKPLEDLTKSEADEWIDRLTPPEEQNA